MSEQKIERWYDKEEQLSLVMRALEFADDDIKISIAADLIQMVLNITMHIWMRMDRIIQSWAAL